MNPRPPMTWERVLVATVKAHAAVLTLGVYPVLPWFWRWHQGWLYRQDVRQERYRQDVRAAARRQRRPAAPRDPWP